MQELLQGEVVEADGLVGAQEVRDRAAQRVGPALAVVGQLDGVELRATYAAETGALLVVLTSAALVVGPERARELVSG